MKTSPKTQKRSVLPYVIIRTERAGVFAGLLKARKGSEVTLEQARRLWYWDGAASLSQLATEGVSRPQNCKFPAPVESIILLGVIEIISATERAHTSIDGVAPWRA